MLSIGPYNYSSPTFRFINLEANQLTLFTTLTKNDIFKSYYVFAMVNLFEIKYMFSAFFNKMHF